MVGMLRGPSKRLAWTESKNESGVVMASGPAAKVTRRPSLEVAPTT